jgi:hypothetical protein
MKSPLTLAMPQILFAALGAAALSAHAACPTWPTEERFAISGEEVTDRRTGLVWKRCSEGQTLIGSSCTGTAAGYTHEQALVRAKSTNATDSATGWRLPNVKELASLADKGCQSPSIDGTALAGTSSSIYLSSTPYWGNASTPYPGNGARVWGVDFFNGGVYQGYRTGSGRVRLVRASQ